MNTQNITSISMTQRVLQGAMGAERAGGAERAEGRDGAGDGEVSFEQFMRKAAGGPSDREKQADLAATGLVSNALILPILKQLRHPMFKEEGPFSPGNGEKAFGPEFDMQLADRIAQSPNLGVRKALAQRLMKRGEPKVAPSLNKDSALHG